MNQTTGWSRNCVPAYLGLLGILTAVTCTTASLRGAEIVVNIDFENIPAVSASETQIGQGAFSATGDVWNSITPAVEPQHEYYGDILVNPGAISASSLLDSQGNATNVSVAAAGAEYAYSWTYYDPNNEATPCTSHVGVMNDWLYSATQNSSVTISGLVPGSAYDLALYGHSHEGGGSTQFTIGGVTQSTGIATASHTLTAGIDYVTYNDVLADQFGKINFKFTDDPVGEKYGGLNGFQIRGEAYTGPPITEPAVSDDNILSGMSASASSTENDWYPQTATDGNAVVTDGVNSDWVAPNGDSNPRLAVWGFNNEMNKIRIWGAGDLDPDEIRILSSTSLITPTDGAFLPDLADSYETELVAMATTTGSWITAGLAGDMPWQMYYLEYAVNAPVGTQSLLFDCGASGRTRIVEVQAFAPDSTLPGDADGNGRVDAADAAILAQFWQTHGGAGWGMGDFNGDGNVDDIDATILAANWQTAATASVPEPSLVVLLCGMVAVFWFRRR